MATNIGLRPGWFANPLGHSREPQAMTAIITRVEQINIGLCDTAYGLGTTARALTALFIREKILLLWDKKSKFYAAVVGAMIIVDKSKRFAPDLLHLSPCGRLYNYDRDY